MHGSLTLNIKVNFAIVGKTESQLPVSVTIRQSRAYQQWLAWCLNVRDAICANNSCMILFVADHDAIRSQKGKHWRYISYISTDKQSKTVKIVSV